MKLNDFRDAFRALWNLFVYIFCKETGANGDGSYR